MFRVSNARVSNARVSYLCETVFDPPVDGNIVSCRGWAKVTGSVDWPFQVSTHSSHGGVVCCRTGNVNPAQGSEFISPSCTTRVKQEYVFGWIAGSEYYRALVQVLFCEGRQGKEVILGVGKRMHIMWSIYPLVGAIASEALDSKMKGQIPPRRCNVPFCHRDAMFSMWE